MDGEESTRPLLTVSITVDGDTLVCRLEGEMDASVLGRLSDALDEALRVHEPRRVRIDMASVVFMDSTGFHEFARVQALVRERDCALEVTDLQPQVYRLFELSALTNLLGD